MTASVTGDDGAPVALTVGAPLAIRNVDVKAYVHIDSAAGAMSYKWQVTDASGVGATTVGGCWTELGHPRRREVRALTAATRRTR